MDNQIFKQYNLKLHILSPVHIGCDDVYEPFSFVIDENKKKLIHFSPIEFMRYLSEEDKNEFSKICMSENILELYKFVKRKYKPNVGFKEIDVTEGIVTHYKKVLEKNFFNKDEVINQFLINRTMYNVNNNIPYIPGSSIKGAIRTAYLSKLAEEKKIKNCRKKSFELERELLHGAFQKDPFRLIKISDFQPIGNIKTKIVYAINKKKKKSNYESKALYQILEIITPNSVFEGTITIFNAEKNSEIVKPISQLNDLLKIVNNFYSNLLENDLGLEISEYMKPELKNNLLKTTFILRIGKHSGAESVTIENNRNIKIQQGKNKKPIFSNHSTTFWVVSETIKPLNNKIVPLGLTLLEII